MRISSRCGKSLPEEVVAASIANLGGDGRVEDRIHGQCQGDDAVATVNALHRVGVCTRGGECLPEEVVATAVADLSGDRCVEDRVDRQRQGDQAVAAVNGLQRVGIRSSRGERLSEEVVAAAVADLGGDGRVNDIVDRQCQGNHAVTTVDALQRVGICSRGGERLPEEVVATAVADFRGEGRVNDIVDRQRQGDDAVATVDALQGMGVCTRCGECLPEEVVAAAVADFRGEGRVEDRVDRQSQGNDAVATVNALQRVGVGSRGGECLPEEVVAAAVADFRGEGVVEDRVDRQRQSDDAVAAVNALHRVGVCTRGDERLPEEVVATAVADLRGEGGA